jgi:hypothetical protein
MTSAIRASALTRLVRACVRLPLLRPIRFRRKRAANPVTAIAVVYADRAGWSSAANSPSATERNAMPTVWFIQSQQPTTNPRRLPKARSEYTYQPPARGSMAASSLTAPLRSSVYTPPTSQIAEVSPAVPMYPATSPGVRRMPPPMVAPTPTAIPKPTPSIRSSRPPRRPASEMYAAVAINVVVATCCAEYYRTLSSSDCFHTYHFELSADERSNCRIIRRCLNVRNHTKAARTTGGKDD